MLTVQMQNQDPLNPISSEDFAVQLATFSSVEQQVTTNDLLRSLVSSQTQSGLLDLSHLIGKFALVANDVEFAAHPVDLVLPNVSQDGATKLVVRDSSGRAVQETPIDLTTRELTWAGVNDDGTPLPTGVYSFEVMQTSANGETRFLPVRAYQQVTEIRQIDGRIGLVLRGGRDVAPTEIEGLRS